MDKKRMETIRRLINALPEEQLAKVLRSMMTDASPEKPAPRRMPTPPATPPKQ